MNLGVQLLPDISTIKQTRSRLSRFIRQTPLLRSQTMGETFFKAETLQVTGSFKARPAFGQLLALDPQSLQQGVVTSSSGNFAQAVSYASAQLGISAKIVMMKSSSALKVRLTRKWGGEVVFCDDRFEARSEMVRFLKEEDGRTEIHPFDHPMGIAGNASAGLEILEACKDVEHIVVPVSGGGLICGIALAAHYAKPEVKIWGVQPDGSNATFLSFKNGAPTRIERACTIADGLMVTAPGEFTFPLIQRLVHDVVTVSEEAITEALEHLIENEKLLVEPSGAVSVAAVLQGIVPLQNTVCLLSGANASLPNVCELIARS